MTKIKYHEDKLHFVLDVNDHANYNPGHDIVCAAASVLTCSLISAIYNEDESVFSSYVVDCDEDDAAVHIDITVYEWEYERIKGMFDVVITGFEMLAEKYPANVSLVIAT